MATLEHDDMRPSSVHPPMETPRLRIVQIIAISIFWFALNFHWSALGLIIIPSQVYVLVGELHKGEALAFVLVPGAFVALFANPLFGLLSDRMRGRFARWGKRRPYILLGTLANIGGLIWMAEARDITSLAIAYLIVQFASNAAQAPFHALLPDIVPVPQRGLTSGIMGLLSIGGNIAGALISGMYIDASKPLAQYQQGLWFTYGIIIVILLVLMLVTIFTVREKHEGARPAQKREIVSTSNTRTSWLNRSLLITGLATLLAAGIVWGLMALWNIFQLFGLHITTDVQQVVLEIVVTLGLFRVFDFNPRRDPDFAWVFVTRLLMMMGIYTIQTFLQYYMRDVVGAAHPEQQTTNFVIAISLTSLFSALGAGWLSDRVGRKRMVYLAGCLMALVGLIFIVTHSLPIVLASGAIFGLGYGAYQSVDWALVADTLPSHENYARDMGVWNISLAIPQIIAPVLGGPLIDWFVRQGQAVFGFQLLFGLAIVYCLAGTFAVRYIRSIK
ncbi:MFS transporter [Ktedonosporobacter rubrisoli]|uniref:MFS transporter n=1 Tax=Ktedonosporobacter rubrisoli TaxID=2509675 RepID=A0A4P6JWQ1_KTERU|nr:MFS transporter [Ktedonosporobacter rubrisoli]QBD80147.1 MFS transporter [Ktedonosporobacter rubrisoli]